MSDLFGTAARVPLLAARPRFTAATVAAHAVTLTGTTATLRPDLDRDRLDVLTDTTVVATTSLSDLADALTRARIAPHALDAALTAWAEQRPATPDEAAAHAVAVLDWHDATCTRLRWTLVVPRPGGHLGPVPDAFTTGTDRAGLWAAAVTRSQAVTRNETLTGAITLITTEPSTLATATLTDPHHPEAGETLYVVTPGAPVAYGPPDAIRRMAAETNEAHAVLDPDALRALTR